MEKPKSQTLEYYVWYDCEDYIAETYGEKYREPLREVLAGAMEMSSAGNDSHFYMSEDGGGYYTTKEEIEAVKLFMDVFATDTDVDDRGCNLYISW